MSSPILIDSADCSTGPNDRNWLRLTIFPSSTPEASSCLSAPIHRFVDPTIKQSLAHRTRSDEHASRAATPLLHARPRRSHPRDFSQAARHHRDHHHRRRHHHVGFDSRSVPGTLVSASIASTSDAFPAIVACNPAFVSPVARLQGVPIRHFATALASEHAQSPPHVGWQQRPPHQQRQSELAVAPALPSCELPERE